MTETFQGPDPQAPGDRTSLDLRRLEKEVEKLTLEVEALRSSTYWERVVGRYLPLITAFLAVAGFWFGIIQFNAQKKDSELKQAEADSQRAEEFQREAARPFWDAQVKLYLRAAEAAATIATAEKDDDIKRAEADFWSLYWGPLAAVEDVGIEGRVKPEVEPAMVEFGQYLLQNSHAVDKKKRLHHLSLKLAHAFRNSFPTSFHLEATPEGHGRLDPRENTAEGRTP